MICPSCQMELEEVCRGVEGDIFCPLCWEKLGNSLKDHIDLSDVTIDECYCEICAMIRGRK